MHRLASCPNPASLDLQSPWPFPSYLNTRKIKMCCLLPLACRGGTWGGVVRLRPRDSASEVLASDSPPRADWLMCWDQDGPGAGRFKSSGWTCAVSKRRPGQVLAAGDGFLASPSLSGGWGGGCFLDGFL